MPAPANLAPLTDFRAGGVIASGADCAGLLSEALALDYLGVEHKHKFAAESNAKLRRLLYWKFGKDSMLFYRNGILRDNTKSELPRVHLYVTGVQTCALPIFRPADRLSHWWGHHSRGGLRRALERSAGDRKSVV